MHDWKPGDFAKAKQNLEHPDGRQKVIEGQIYLVLDVEVAELNGVNEQWLKLPDFESRPAAVYFKPVKPTFEEPKRVSELV